MAEGPDEGAPPPPQSRWGFRDKTVWNWLELLGVLAIPVVIPVVIFVGGWLLTRQQDARQRDIEEQRAQDAALQSYTDQMSQLILDENLLVSEVDSPERTLARARTLTVLERLDPIRKAEVMRFLVEAELVQANDEEGRSIPGGPVIGLNGADLSEADLSDFELTFSVVLSGADLSDADLSDRPVRCRREGCQ